jgi:hypothetical protein
MAYFDFTAFNKVIKQEKIRYVVDAPTYEEALEKIKAEFNSNNGESLRRGHTSNLSVDLYTSNDDDHFTNIEMLPGRYDEEPTFELYDEEDNLILDNSTKLEF